MIHSMECPIEQGRAESVARWFGGPTAPQASAHYMVDPGSVWCGVRPPAEAWHCGGANRYAGGASIGIEQTGYAAYDAEWRSPDGLRQLDLLADLTGSLCDRYGIDRVWLNADQLRAGVSGITTHGFLSSIGMGTDHTDPGPRWPVSDFMARLNPTPPNPAGDDEVNVWFMRAAGDPAVYVVQANLSGRWHLTNAAQADSVAYVIGLNGAKVLVPPADTKPESLGRSQVWVVAQDFLKQIPVIG